MQREHVQSGTGATIKSPERSDGKRRLVRGEGLVARISNVYRPQLPMITMDIPQPVVPCYLGTVRLDESADTRKRSWERVDSRPYPDSEESEDDVVYAEEHENELQQINLRNAVTNQITVDTCGERCARLDDFNWFLPTDEWYGKSDAPESEIDTPYSGNGVHVIASDSSSLEMDTIAAAVVKPPPPPPPGGRSDET